MASILIVDDHGIVAEGVADILGAAGHRVRTLTQVDRLTAALDADPPDLAIVDLVFSGQALDGLDALYMIEARDPRPKVILLTAGGMDRSDLLSWALAACPWVDGTLRKAASSVELRDAVRGVLNGQRLRDANLRMYEPSGDMEHLRRIHRWPYSAIVYRMASGDPDARTIAGNIGLSVGRVRNEIRALADVLPHDIAPHAGGGIKRLRVFVEASRPLIVRIGRRAGTGPGSPRPTSRPG